MTQIVFVIDEEVLNELRLRINRRRIRALPQECREVSDASARSASPPFTVVWNGGRGSVRMVTEVTDERC